MENKMQLVYTATQKPVTIGDVVPDFRGDLVKVISFDKPHKSSSVGKIILKENNSEHQGEYYVSVIGAGWINRDDK